MLGPFPGFHGKGQQRAVKMSLLWSFGARNFDPRLLYSSPKNARQSAGLSRSVTVKAIKMASGPRKTSTSL